jgi:Ca-activated chloride channel family protein
MSRGSPRRLALIAVALACLASTSLSAAPSDMPGSGELMLHGKGVATTIPAMQLGTDIDVTVSGQIARVRVTQAFRNTGKGWMEATYLYPLPEDGAVDSLKMVVGQRIFIGHIKRREEARADYEKARSEGRQAGLVEEERANLFRNNVANVGPGQTVLISIEFQAPIRQLGGEFALRLPLVAGPRYVTAQTPARDGEAITAPLADPALGKALNPVTIAVHLNPGFAPANIISPYHRITVRDEGGNAREILLAKGAVPADRDFELRWRSAGADPTIGLFRQELAGKRYLMATITPPALQTIGTVPPREMVFVIDNSGSMGGTSIEAAKASILYALGTLRPQDSFNIIRFDDTMTQLFDHSVPASADQLATAQHYVETLHAAGGTEMLPALKAALVDHAATQGVRQVVFLTDGDLSNEPQMMAEIAQHGGRSRVFMIGIGSAPNQFLMHRMAEAGRGTYTNIGSREEVTSKMTALLDRLKAPAVHDLTVKVEGSPLDLTPARLPDLYAGEPLTLLGKGDKLDGRLVVSGMIGDHRWTQSIDLSGATDSPAIARLWAGRRIADVEAQHSAGQMNDTDVDEALARLGLDYGIVTRQTSLIAQDETPVRPAGATLTREELPLLLPAGWDFDTLLGHGGTDAAMPGGGADQGEQLALPQTASNFADALMRGIAVLVLGLGGLIATRRRKGEVA